VVDKFQEDVGHFNTHFTNLALTGFLSPWVPGLLGFRIFGKGIGGICRTAAVSTVTAIYTASVSSPGLRFDSRGVNWDLSGPQKYIQKDGVYKSLQFQNKNTMHFHSIHQKHDEFELQ
jgi:hypothetical protein